MHQKFVLDCSNWEIPFCQHFHNFLAQVVINLSQAHIYWWAIQNQSLKRSLITLKEQSSDFPKVVRVHLFTELKGSDQSDMQFFF